jgi:hypothetical protein
MRPKGLLFRLLVAVRSQPMEHELFAYSVPLMDLEAAVEVSQ